MQLLTNVFALTLFRGSHAILAMELVPFRRPNMATLLSKPSARIDGVDGGRVNEVTGDMWDKNQAEDWSEDKETLLFGDTECPCIGFENIEGSINFTYSWDPEHHQSLKITYPGDVGSRCSKWEAKRHPDCRPGGNPGAGKGWCNQAWCFVDPCNCNIPILPARSIMAQHMLYRGRQIHYSYATCGGKDVFGDARPKIGHASCKCVGFSNVPWKNDVSWTNGSQTWNMQYPGDMGGSCQAWDEDVHPLCKNAGPERPDWCNKRWCFVDPCECDMPTPPKVTMHLPWATFTGKSLYYSYETCGDPDSFTATMNTEACVNQKTFDKCLALRVRNGVQKCAWTGARCLGAELVHHPLCTDLETKIMPEYMRRTRQEIAEGLHSQARQRSSVAGLELFLFLVLGSVLISGESKY